MSVTPPRDSPAIEALTTALQSTPLNQGAGSHESYDTETQRIHYYGYLADDTKHTAQIEFDTFVWLVWSAKLDNLEASAERIFREKKFQPLLESYCDEVSEETDRYHPFVQLANHILALDNHSSLAFVRNDRSCLWGSYAQRKPDVLFIFREALRLGERHNEDNLSKAGPSKGDEFHWGDPLDFWEFKLKLKKYPGPQEALMAAAPKPFKKPLTSENRVKTQSQEALRRSSRNATASKTKESSDKLLSAPVTKKRSSPGNTEQVEKKFRTEEPPEEPYLQSASYALEMFSHGNLRNHVLGAVVTDFSIEILYYDRSVTVKSTPFYFVENPRRFVALLVAYAGLSDRQRGLETKITPKFLTPGIRGNREARQPLIDFFAGQILEIPGFKIKFKLQETIFRQHALIGRGTCVLRAVPSKPLPGQNNLVHKVVIVKLGWLSVSRAPEAKIIDSAIRAASTSAHQWVKKHLPEVLHSHVYPPDKDGPHVKLIEHLNDPKYDKRELRLIVQGELFPITRLTKAEDVKRVFLDILECHEWLYTEAKILHRDISLGNLMYRTVNGQHCGVLNDFDLASYVVPGHMEPTSNQRTGTKPFMAIDLLRQSPPPRHLYRHDLESFFYVLLFFVSRYLDGAEIEDPPLQLWLTKGDDRLGEAKGSFLFFGAINPTENFAKLRFLLLGMKSVLADGIDARRRHEFQAELTKAQGLNPPLFDDETLGGHVSFAKFKGLFALAP
ncbi:hypothetical protein BU17DRAFT_96662 [Hysterangium stoloniferum]|nr:hypothetical protein BU17DRAFT_96662 [Hysterangium stoloniferum]